MIVADLLETIVAATRRAVELRASAVPSAALERRIERRPQGDAFRAALGSSNAPRIIAECKRRSPSRGILRADYDPAAHAAAYARAGAAAISVLTEPTFFDGSLDHLTSVRAAVDVPVLRKDFVVDRYQLIEAAAHGADAALLIVGALDDRSLTALLHEAAQLGLAALVEVHDAEELRSAIGAGAEIVGVNSRNLRTLSVDLSVLEDLIVRMPPSATAVAESGIRDSDDIRRLTAAGYHAFLVGERLIVEADPGAALRSLRGGTSAVIRVKICGVRRIEDAVLAVELGASAVGFIFWPSSPRFLEPDAAARIVDALPPFVTAVGVFVDQPVEYVTDVARGLKLGAVQLHGHEAPESYAGAPARVIKAFGVTDAGGCRAGRNGRPARRHGAARRARSCQAGWNRTCD